MTALYTFQLAKWRAIDQLGLPWLDTTVKSGAVQTAPTWAMVRGIKQGTLSEAAYTRLYYARLDYWWDRDPLFFEELLTYPSLALGCYCRPGTFCHRHLLVSYLTQTGQAHYGGERP